MSDLLQLKGVMASYGASQALFGVDLRIGEGEAVALMGRNGMGKTTTIRVIMRMLQKAGGAIHFRGREISGLPSHEVAKSGIGLVPEGRRCFAPLSVEENLLAAARPGPWDIASVSGLFPRLGERRTQKAALLSGGEQQMLAIGRALTTNPRLLILDEATEGLAPMVRQEIWAAIGKLKQGGLSLLVVDKSIRELTAVVDRCVIIEKGMTVWEGQPGELTGDVTSRYLGV